MQSELIETSHTGQQRKKVRLIKGAHPPLKDIPDENFHFKKGGGGYSDEDSFCHVIFNGQELFIKCNRINAPAKHGNVLSPRNEALFNNLTFKTTFYKHPDVKYYEGRRYFVYISKHLKYQDKAVLDVMLDKDGGDIDLTNIIRKHAIDWYIYNNHDNKLENSVFIKKGEVVKSYTIDVLTDAKRVRNGKSLAKSSDISSSFVSDLVRKMANYKDNIYDYWRFYKRIFNEVRGSSIIIFTMLQLMKDGEEIFENLCQNDSSTQFNSIQSWEDENERLDNLYQLKERDEFKILYQQVDCKTRGKIDNFFRAIQYGNFLYCKDICREIRTGDKIMLYSLQKLIGCDEKISQNICQLKERDEFKILYQQVDYRTKQNIDQFFVGITKNAKILNQAIRQGTAQYEKQYTGHQILSYKKQRREKANYYLANAERTASFSQAGILSLTQSDPKGKKTTKCSIDQPKARRTIRTCFGGCFR